MIPVDFITALFYYVDAKLPGLRAKNLLLTAATQGGILG